VATDEPEATAMPLPPHSPQGGPLLVSIDPVYTTEPNNYGVVRVFDYGCPSWSPDEVLLNQSTSLDELARSQSQTEYYAPFPNASIFRLISWMHTGSVTKTIGEVDRLVDEVILAEDFQRIDLVGFRATKELKRIGNNNTQSNTHFASADGWKQGSVHFALPCEKVRHKLPSDVPVFTVSGIYYKDPLGIMKSALQSNAQHFHFTPYREFWQPEPGQAKERVYGEVYSADMFIQEHHKVRLQSLNGPTPTIEAVVCAILLYSDSTHLTSFGSASLWPIYMYFGNMSKYMRSRTGTSTAYHLAYIPKVFYVIFLLIANRFDIILAHR
jgi:hypothetical protein